MKKIFMLVNYTPSDLSIGITKKIHSEISALRNLGYQVYYTAYNTNGVSVYDGEDKEIYSEKYTFPRGKLRIIYRYFDLLLCVIHYVSSMDKENKFDYCYARISAMNSRYCRLLRLFKKMGAKVLVEAHAYFPGVQMKGLKGKYIASTLNHRRNVLQEYVDLFLTEGYVESFYGVKTLQVKIGVDTSSLQRHIYNGSPGELNLISVASEQIYHGYDRLILSVADYVKKGFSRQINLHLVGELKEDTKNLITENGLEKYVHCYGKVYGDSLNKIYAKCNVGVGPLAQHRIGGKKDTGLKTKEYFGIGIPYFYSGCEPDVPKDYPYILEVPSDESLINFNQIWDFYNSWRDNPNVADEMREFATRVFSWDSIMSEIMETAEKI